MTSVQILSLILSFLALIPSGFSVITTTDGFSIEEATIVDLQSAFRLNKLTSRQLTLYYLQKIQRLDPVLHAVLEVNPDALHQADEADQERYTKKKIMSGLHGIPILIKDLIATKDKLNTTAGSLALIGSVVPRDAGVVTKLRQAGAIILGKASLSEWSNFRSFDAPTGWCARSGQGKNPYVASATTCGSSSGSAIAVAANMVAVSLGTETDGSILCPSSYNSVVGVKPTVGLTSRAGVIPISPRMDTIGTVTDAVYVLEAIVGYDGNDDKATRKASKYIPVGGYKQFLKQDGLKGKRLGIVRSPFFVFSNDSAKTRAFEHHFDTFRRQGAILVDNLHIANLDIIIGGGKDEEIAMKAEFKLSLNEYLKALVASPVHSLADIIAFNKRHSIVERVKEYGQNVLEASEATRGIGETEKSALLNLTRLSKDGFEKMMKDYKLDAMVSHGADATSLLAIGGFPGISVPAGYDNDGVPFGICFGGLKGYEPRLIEIAYAFEQVTKIRIPPPTPFNYEGFAEF